MNRITKLIILIILSLSVYFIYQYTNNTNIKITTLGDNLSIGINSYCCKDYGFMNIYKDHLLEQNKKVTLNFYSKKDLSIKELVKDIKTNNKLKRTLMESHELYLVVGYNDLVYKLSLEENITSSTFNHLLKEINNDYEDLIKEIRKYYKEKIIVIGYYKSNKDDYYLNKGIKKLNNILKSNIEVKYVDTYNLLNDKKYFSNPKSYYPNILGYQIIANKLIENQR